MTFKNLQNIRQHIHDWPLEHSACRNLGKDVWPEQSEHFWEDWCRSVIVLQLPDLSLMTVNFTLQSFNLLFVVVNFFLVVLLQRGQLLLLLTPCA